MKKYVVRFYRRLPLDISERWIIHREIVEAESADEAIKLVADTHIEIIDAAEYAPASGQEPKPVDLRTPEQRDLDAWQADWQSTYQEMR